MRSLQLESLLVSRVNSLVRGSTKTRLSCAGYSVAAKKVSSRAFEKVDGQDSHAGGPTTLLTIVQGPRELHNALLFAVISLFNKLIIVAPTATNELLI